MKKGVVISLLEEQGGLCCYCGQAIDMGSCHIEHFMPQSRYPEKALNYENFHASCQRQRKKKMPEYCGVAKGDWFDHQLTLSPLEPQCEKAFLFFDDGQMTPKDPENIAAQETLKHLKLNETTLTILRAEAIAGFLDEDFIAHATQEELSLLSSKIMLHKPDGSFEPFCFAIRQRICRLLA